MIWLLTCIFYIKILLQFCLFNFVASIIISKSKKTFSYNFLLYNTLLLHTSAEVRARTYLIFGTGEAPSCRVAAHLSQGEDLLHHLLQPTMATSIRSPAAPSTQDQVRSSSHQSWYPQSFLKLQASSKLGAWLTGSL